MIVSTSFQLLVQIFVTCRYEMIDMACSEWGLTRVGGMLVGMVGRLVVLEHNDIIIITCLVSCSHNGRQPSSSRTSIS